MASEARWLLGTLLLWGLVYLYFTVWLPVWDWWLGWFRHDRKG